MNTNSRAEYYPPFLGSDIRFAADYCEGRVRKDDLITHANSGGVNEAAYMVVNGTTAHPDLQVQFLTQFADAVLLEGGREFLETRLIRECIVDFVRNLTEDLHFTVDGIVKFVNAEGLPRWNRRLRTVAEKANVPRPLLLTSKLALLGLRHFIRARRLRGDSIYIPIEEWHDDVRTTHWGHVITPTAAVYVVDKNSVVIPQDSVIINDEYVYLNF